MSFAAEPVRIHYRVVTNPVPLYVLAGVLLALGMIMGFYTGWSTDVPASAPGVRRMTSAALNALPWHFPVLFAAAVGFAAVLMTAMVTFGWHVALEITRDRLRTRNQMRNFDMAMSDVGAIEIQSGEIVVHDRRTGAVGLKLSAFMLERSAADIADAIRTAQRAAPAGRTFSRVPAQPSPRIATAVPARRPAQSSERPSQSMVLGITAAGIVGCILLTPLLIMALS